MPGGFSAVRGNRASRFAMLPCSFVGLRCFRSGFQPAQSPKPAPYLPTNTLEVRAEFLTRLRFCFPVSFPPSHGSRHFPVCLRVLLANNKLHARIDLHIQRGLGFRS